ncbi:GL26459 [Drosophila persimilis]|uniref:Uncharacterized protein Sws1 n=2 Tax=pseudoobscura subgroup TaxID=32358 RepID=A0A6I8UY25_DROPS|nr:uncharacterized protein LOC6596385 [Drosophila persimilis]XP_002133073.2 uncharacterized protein LOC6902533 [Drosophila pseudoobscura]EDW25381.1 GL26459 [Drosophila persimilis]
MAVELATLTDSFLPEVVDLIFKNYQDKSHSCGLSKEDRKQLFYHLSQLLGAELVERSLHLLDRYSFIYYYSKNNRKQCVAELHKGTLYYRVIPGNNYCKCDFFQSHVLQLPSGVLYHDLPRDITTTLDGWSDASRVSYTCPHVLALKLHQLLQHPAEQAVADEEFRALRSSIYLD